ncbi:hypothetical protein RJ640_020224 [Escallonia rubra]|uniref:Uncharacterized protein n=1 Tax=Escallonia rubra TaxID=112253 RepID=A0AA88UBB1_9ASTE|nr:hypothetical protein RJ640_020224 [Escallonia rubra]
MYFHGARFSNYEAWLSDPTHIGPSAQGLLRDSKGSSDPPFTTTEVKIKITKKQLEELLGKIDVKGLPVQQVLAQLMSAGDGYKAHQKSWRPALQSIPEV